jgi:hypothetical protein
VRNPRKQKSIGEKFGLSFHTCNSHQATATLVSVSKPRYTVLKAPRPISLAYFIKRLSGLFATASSSSSS